MKEAARKTNIRLRVRGRQGLPFFLYKNRFRKLLGIGSALFFLILYVSSFFIWDISYEGNLRFTDDIISGYLKTVPIYQGMKKTKISCDDLEAGIRNAFPEITWVSAEICGTRLIIRIKENDVLTEPLKPDMTPCDLSADKSGVVTNIVVRNGFSVVKVGDEVERGTLLVDGTVPIYDDSGTMVNSYEIHADADILAETVYSVKKRIDLSRNVKVRTGNFRKGIYIRLLENPFYFLFPSYNECSWEFIMERKQVHLLENFYLPVYYGRIAAYEYEEYERFYTEKEVKVLCEEYIREYIEKLSEKGIQILGSDGKIEFNESGWTLMGTIRVIENIAVETHSSGKDEEN